MKYTQLEVMLSINVIVYGGYQSQFTRLMKVTLCESEHLCPSSRQACFDGENADFNNNCLHLSSCILAFYTFNFPQTQKLELGLPNNYSATHHYNQRQVLFNPICRHHGKFLFLSML